MRLVLVYPAPDPEAEVVLIWMNAARSLERLRPKVRSGSPLDRMRSLLLALALANAAGALAVAAVATTNTPILYAAGVAAPVAVSATWLLVYRRRHMTPLSDAATIAAAVVATAAADVRWQTDIDIYLTGAAIFVAAFSSRRGLVIRTTLLSAIALGHGIAHNRYDAAVLPTATVFVLVCVVLAGLVYAVVRVLEGYERTSRREQILSAMGLELVTASDLKGIASAALEAALWLCPDPSRARAIMAVRDEDEPEPRFAVVGARGLRSIGLEASEVRATAGTDVGGYTEQIRVESGDHWDIVLPVSSAVPEPDLTSEPDVARSQTEAEPAAEPPAAEPPAAEPAGKPAGKPAGSEGQAPPEPESPRSLKLGGDVLVTRITVSGVPRALLVVESLDPLEAEADSVMRALATQVSLAIARTDLQRDAIEQQSAARFQALIQSSSDVISIVTPDGRIRYQSPSAFQVFGYEPEQVIGTGYCDLVHPDDADRVCALFEQVLGSGDYAVGECRIRHCEGSWLHTEVRMTNLVDVESVGGIVVNARDVTERHNLEAELRHQAFHDSLTGLANRTLFVNRVEHALTSAQRDNSTVGVLLCDLAGFKRINDSLGLSAGDNALVMVAERLRGSVRGQDTVARLGGNEFGVLLDRLATPADATLAMERIMAMLRQPLILPGAQVELQPHVGVAVATAGDGNADDLLRNGAVAMHQARVYEGGYAIFDPQMHAEAIRRMEMESLLRTAIDERQFVLHYQPLVDLQTGRLTGVEALVRWQHPRRGLVPPLEFVPLAEETGLIVPLGQWAIAEACNQVRHWQKEIPADEPIALNVNLSARQLRHPNIVRDIADALDDSGLPPGRLILEITESVLMIDTAATLSRLFQLKSLGVRLAVDDFGTGYSSFAYLRRFPVDILKIDKSFVDGVATEPTASALVDAMIRIGKTLRLETVAEGVERADQAERLRSLQCDLGQGYLFARPQPSETITQMLREHAAKRSGSQPAADAA
jgi:diguanylate cyclase (GGDEF)-like protein/PAS domain S-box-containing protein